MKKIILVALIIFFLVGCDAANTPTSKVEELLMKYQKNDKEVLSDLDAVTNEEMTFNENQRRRYRDIVKNNYKDLTYEVKDETINGDSATVEVEIEVKDLTKVMYQSDLYFQANPDEFTVDGNYSQNKYTDYRLDELEKAKDKVKYTLEIRLQKTNNKWTVIDLSDIDVEKINGTYKY